MIFLKSFGIYHFIKNFLIEYIKIKVRNHKHIFNMRIFLF